MNAVDLAPEDFPDRTVHAGDHRAACGASAASGLSVESEAGSERVTDYWRRIRRFFSRGVFSAGCSVVEGLIPKEIELRIDTCSQQYPSAKSANKPRISPPGFQKTCAQTPRLRCVGDCPMCGATGLAAGGIPSSVFTFFTTPRLTVCEVNLYGDLQLSAGEILQNEEGIAFFSLHHLFLATRRSIQCIHLPG